MNLILICTLNYQMLPNVLNMTSFKSDFQPPAPSYNVKRLAHTFRGLNVK